jgi:dephospho-CoA kinase
MIYYTSMKRIILGITGLNGSGKSTVAGYLKDHHGFKYFSVRSYILKELEKRNLEPIRENMRVIANEMRHQHGAGYFLQEIKKDIGEINDNVVIESIRTLNEARELRDLGVDLLAVTASPELRYQRVVKRKSETDQVSYEEFLEGERRESVSEDPNQQNLAKVGACADYTLVNDDIEQFYKDINTLIQEIQKKS